MEWPLVLLVLVIFVVLMFEGVLASVALPFFLIRDGIALLLGKDPEPLGTENENSIKKLAVSSQHIPAKPSLASREAGKESYSRFATYDPLKSPIFIGEPYFMPARHKTALATFIGSIVIVAIVYKFGTFWSIWLGQNVNIEILSVIFGVLFLTSVIAGIGRQIANKKMSDAGVFLWNEDAETLRVVFGGEVPNAAWQYKAWPRIFAWLAATLVTLIAAVFGAGIFSNFESQVLAVQVALIFGRIYVSFSFVCLLRP